MRHELVENNFLCIMGNDTTWSGNEEISLGTVKEYGSGLLYF
jgi:hypothetical protein